MDHALDPADRHDAEVEVPCIVDAGRYDTSIESAVEPLGAGPFSRSPATV